MCVRRALFRSQRRSNAERDAKLHKNCANSHRASLVSNLSEGRNSTRIFLESAQAARRTDARRNFHHDPAGACTRFLERRRSSRARRFAQSFLGSNSISSLPRDSGIFRSPSQTCALAGSQAVQGAAGNVPGAAQVLRTPNPFAAWPRAFALFNFACAAALRGARLDRREETMVTTNAAFVRRHYGC